MSKEKITQGERLVAIEIKLEAMIESLNEIKVDVKQMSETYVTRREYESLKTSFYKVVAGAGSILVGVITFFIINFL